MGRWVKTAGTTRFSLAIAAYTLVKRNKQVKMDEISKLSYEGNLEILKLRIRENNALASKTDEVNLMLLFISIWFQNSFSIICFDSCQKTQYLFRP